jgi:hypothetical protein
MAAARASIATGSRSGPSAKLGTGCGETVSSAVLPTTFDGEDNAVQRITIRYESRQRLVTLGVLATPRWRLLNPFASDFVPELPPRS